jgi:hypothetical protein
MFHSLLLTSSSEAPRMTGGARAFRVRHRHRQQRIDVRQDYLSVAIEPAERTEAVLCIVRRGVVEECRWFSREFRRPAASK